MGKTIRFLILCTFLTTCTLAQSDQFSQLNQQNVTGFSKPLITTLGMGINSGAFYTAHVPSTFGFSISLRGMLITVPDDQLTFTPTLPNGYKADQPAPTFWGAKGGESYIGPNGYVSFPGGINEQSIPFVMPQITASFLGTEVLLRYIPSINAGDEKFSFFGIGVKHSISRYIPLLPIDIAVQFLYNKVTFSDIVDGSNIAFNAEASKSFGVFTAYGGLQYESTKFSLNYTFKGDPNSDIEEFRHDKKISVDVNGDNSFRFILGGSLKLAVLVINADINLGSQTVYSTGLSFEL